MRKLASIQKITALDPIPKADRIEVARIQGWDVVVQKGLYEVNDLVCYFEIDSILPDQPWCEFMRDRKFRVKTIKLRKQISQGLCIPTSECLDGWTTADIREGTDITDILGVKKHDPEGDKERKENVSGRQPVPHAWMMRFSLTRKLHQLLWPRKKGSWPEWFPKTDEIRIQNIRNVDDLVKDRIMYWTEKLDGQSCTIFYARDQKVGLFKKGLFGVCSRNIWYKNEVANNWWNIAKAYRVDEMLPEFCDNTERSLAVQGEICGPGIQGNKYGLTEHQFFVFSIYDIEIGKYVTKLEKTGVCTQLGLDEVPKIGATYFPEGTDYLGIAEGDSVLKKDVEREGLVFRSMLDDSLSFKAISNKFLLKEGRK